MEVAGNFLLVNQSRPSSSELSHRFSEVINPLTAFSLSWGSVSVSMEPIWPIDRNLSDRSLHAHWHDNYQCGVSCTSQVLMSVPRTWPRRWYLLEEYCFAFHYHKSWPWVNSSVTPSVTFFEPAWKSAGKAWWRASLYRLRLFCHNHRFPLCGRGQTPW